MEDKWITTSEASQIVGVTSHQIRKLLRDGKIKYKKFGWAYMVNRESAEAYAVSYRRPGPKPKHND